MFDLIFWYINNITEPWAPALAMPYIVVVGLFFGFVCDGLVDYLPKLRGKTYTCWVVGVMTFILTVPFWHIVYLTLAGYWAVEFYSRFINEWKCT